MSTKNSISCKKWRKRQENNKEYWEKERNRKKKQRKLRTEEQKNHDKELARVRQRTFREKKKQREKNKSSTLIDSQLLVSESHEKSTSNANDFGMETPTIGNAQWLPDSIAHSQNEGCRQPEEDNPIFNNIGFQSLASFPMATDNTSVKLAGHHEDSTPLDLNAGSDKRDTHFTTLQKQLQQLNNYELMRMKCRAENEVIEKLYPITSLADEYGAQLRKDTVAETLYPQEDAPKGYVPIVTGADGNCLPRAGSLFAFGNEERHTEIRVRIFMELCLFEDFYLNDTHLNRGVNSTTANLASILAQCANGNIGKSDTTRDIYRKYVEQILRENFFNSMWSIFALASVLRVMIFSIYPSCGFYYRSYFHRLVMPRENKNPGELIHIMWTNTAGKVHGPQWWIPNHFVAVLRESEIRLNAESGAKRKTTDNLEHRNKKTRPTFTKSPLLSPSNLEDIAYMHENDTGKEGILDEIVHNKTRDRFNSVKEFCPEHPTQETVYLCTTCRESPICYKCPLENHKGHDIKDLEIHLKEAETQYLETLEINCQRLETELQRRKRYIRENVNNLHSNIDQRLQDCVEKLLKWKEECKTNLGEYYQTVHSKVSEMENKLVEKRKNREQFYEVINALPVTQRLSMMAEEQPINIENKYPFQDIELYPGTDELMVKQFGELRGKTQDHSCNQNDDAVVGSSKIMDAAVVDKTVDSGNGRQTSMNQGLIQDTHQSDALQQTRCLNGKQNIQHGSNLLNTQPPMVPAITPLDRIRNQNNDIHTYTGIMSLRNPRYTTKGDDENYQKDINEFQLLHKGYSSRMSVKDRVHVTDLDDNLVYTITKDGDLVRIHKLPDSARHVCVSPVDESLWYVKEVDAPSYADDAYNVLQQTSTGDVIKFTLVSYINDIYVLSDGNVIIRSFFELMKYTDTGDLITKADIDCYGVKECPTTLDILCIHNDQVTLFDSLLEKQRDISNVSLGLSGGFYSILIFGFDRTGNILLGDRNKIVMTDHITGEYIRTAYKCLHGEFLAGIDTDHNNKLWILFRNGSIKCIQL